MPTARLGGNAPVTLDEGTSRTVTVAVANAPSLSTAAVSFRPNLLLSGPGIVHPASAGADYAVTVTHSVGTQSPVTHESDDNYHFELPAGVSRATVVITATADAVLEEEEAFVIAFSEVRFSDLGTGTDAAFPAGASSVFTTINGGICARTEAVRDAIVEEVRNNEGNNSIRCNDINASHLSRIAALIVSNQPITTLDEDDLAGLTSLDELTLHNNGLTSTRLSTAVFSQLGDTLQSLTIMGNRGLTEFPPGPPGIFDPLTRLTVLNLNGNGLTRLNANVFDNLDALETLNLNNNRLSTLSATMFRELGNTLTTLSIGFNGSLTRLPADVFNDLTELTTLFLNENTVLADLDKDIFDPLDALQNLNLDRTSNRLPVGIFDEVLDTLEVLRVDSEHRSFVALPPPSRTVREGNEEVVVQLRNNADDAAMPALTTVRVSYTVVFGGDRDGIGTAEDFGGLTDGMLDFNAGDTQQAISVSVSQTALPGATAIITLSEIMLLDGEGQVRGVDPLSITDQLIQIDSSEHTLTVAWQVVSVSAATSPPSTPVIIVEDGGEAVVTAELDVPASGSGIEIPYRIEGAGITPSDIRIDGASDAPASLTGHTLTISPGQTTGTVIITAYNDFFDEADETLIVILSDSVSPPIVVGGDSTAAVTIADDDVAPVATLVADPAIAEEFNNTAAVVTLGLAPGTSSGAATVTFTLSTATGTATLGADYALAITHPDDSGSVVVIPDPLTATGGVFRLPDGVNEAVFIITPVADADEEEDEDVVITVTGVAFAVGVDIVVPASATVVIADYGDLPSVSLVGNAPVTLDESASRTVTVVAADAPSLFTAVVSFRPDLSLSGPGIVHPAGASDAGADYAVTAVHSAGTQSPVTHEDGGYRFELPAGVSRATVVITATTDAVLEEEETFVIAFDEVRFSDLGDGTDAAFPAGASSVFTTIVGGTCARTEAVRDAILEAVRDNEGDNSIQCSNVNALHLGGIVFLDLGERGISALDEGDFAGLSALEYLWLDRNALTELPSGVFSGLGSLTFLTLAYNDLTELRPGVFAGLGSLTTLRLFNNDLAELPSVVFAGLGDLTTLWLFNNDLAELPPGVFAGLGSLTTLWLFNNDLAELPPGVFDSLDALADLSLADNDGLDILPGGVFDGVLDTLTDLRLDDALKGVISFAEGRSEVEQGDAATITVTRTLPYAAVNVPYTAQFGGSPAAAPADFLGEEGTLAFAVGETSAAIVVTAGGNAPLGGTVTLTLGTPALNADTRDPPDADVRAEVVEVADAPADAHTLTVAAAVTLAVSAAAGEGGAIGAVVELNRPAHADAVVTYTVAGVGDNPIEEADIDGTLDAVRTVSITAGRRQAEISIAVVDDNAVEGTETGTIAVTGIAFDDGLSTTTLTAVSVIGTGVVAVGDNDRIIVSLADAAVRDYEGTLVYTVSAVADPVPDGGGGVVLERAVSVFLNTDAGSAEAPDDYIALSDEEVIFPVNAVAQTNLVQTVDITIVDDTDTAPETFSLTLANLNRDGTAAPGTAAATVTIVPNPQAGYAPAPDLAAAEGASGDTAALTINLTHVLDAAATVAFTLTGGAAQTGSLTDADVDLMVRGGEDLLIDRDDGRGGTFIIASGVAATTVVFTATDDGDDTDERIVFTVVSIIFAGGVPADIASLAPQTIAIQDDDVALATLTADPATAGEFNNTAAVVTLGLAPGIASGVAMVTFTLSTATGTATPGEDYALAITHPGDSGSVVVIPDSLTATGGVFQLPDGVNEAVFIITPVADADDEEDEDVVITVTGVTFAVGGDVAAPTSATVVIADYGDLPSVSLVGNAPVTLDESASRTVTVVVADAPSLFTATVSFRPDLSLSGPGIVHPAGASDAGADYAVTAVHSAGTQSPVTHEDGGYRFELPAGVSRATVVITATADAVLEEEETFVIAFSEVRFSDLGDGTDDAFPAVSSVFTTIVGGICARTEAVRDAIVAAVRDNEGDNSIQCSNVTASHLDGIVFLNLGEQGISALDEGDFAGLSALTTLWLFNNALTELPPGVFAGLGNLTTLWLFNNALGELRTGVFAGLDSLRTLWLFHNDLTTLDSGLFDGLDALADLSLADNDDLTALPDRIFDDVLDTLAELRLDIALKGVLSFAESRSEVGQGAAAAITVTRTLPYAAVNVPYTAQFGESPAAAPADFLGEEGTLAFAAGETSAVIAVTAVGNAPLGGTVTLTLGTPALSADTRDPPDADVRAEVVEVADAPADAHTLTVAAAVTLAVSAAAGEGGAIGAVVELNRPAHADAVVTYTVAGVGDNPIEEVDIDGTLDAVRTVSITAGRRQAEISIAVVDDNAVEGTETGTIAVTGIAFDDGLSTTTLTAVSVIGTGVVAVGDNDRIIVSLADAAVRDYEGTLVYTVSAVADPVPDGGGGVVLERAVSVFLNTDAGSAEAPDDYIALSDEEVIFPVNAVAQTNLVQTVDITIIDDTDTAPETFSLTLANLNRDGTAAPGTAVATVTIVPNPQAGYAPAPDLAAAEGDGGDTAALTINLTHVLDAAATVAFTLTGGAAQTGSLTDADVDLMVRGGEDLLIDRDDGRGGTFIIASGVAATTVVFTATDDGDDTDERIVFTVVSIIFAGGVPADIASLAPQTIAIQDDDVALATLTADPATAGEFNNTAAVVTLGLAPGIASGVAMVTFTLSTATGTATLGADYVLAITHPGDSGSVVVIPDSLTATGGVFQLPDGVNEAVFIITPVADADDEEDEDVVITVTGVTFAVGGDVAAPTSATVVIADYGDLPSVSLVGNAPVTLDESASRTVTVAVADAPSLFTATVSFRPDLSLSGPGIVHPAGASDAGADYAVTAVHSAGTQSPVTHEDGGYRFELPAGVSRATVVITATADAVLEEEETFVIAFSEVRFSDLGDGTDDAFPAASSVFTTIVGGICARTEAVRDAIVAAVRDNEGDNSIQCSNVNALHLGGIVFLNLGERGISALDEGDFAGLGALTTLWLFNNALTELPPGVFAGLGNLTTLWLFNNALGELRAGVFAGLGSLETLWLFHNDLTTLDSDVFNGLDALVDLSLVDNDDLNTLPDRIFDDVLDTLTDLRLDDALKGVISFAESRSDVGQGDAAMITVTRTLPYAAVNVPYTAQFGGSPAAAPADFLGEEGTLAFAAGEISAVIAVTAVGNAPLGGTVTLTLGTPALSADTRDPSDANVRAEVVGVADAPADAHTLTVIIPPPGVNLTPAAAAAEEDRVAGTLTLTISNPPANATAVIAFDIGGTAALGADYALAVIHSIDTDVTPDALAATGNTFTLPGDVSEAVFIVTPVDDEIADPGETVAIIVTGVDFHARAGLDGLSHEGIVAIADNEATAVRLFAVNPGAVTEGTSAVFTVALNGDAPGDVVIPYVITGTGITPRDVRIDGASDAPVNLTGNTLTIAGGEKVGTIIVTAYDDFLDEDDEILILTLRDSIIPSAPAIAVAGNSTAALTIMNRVVEQTTVTVSFVQTAIALSAGRAGAVELRTDRRLRNDEEITVSFAVESAAGSTAVTVSPSEVVFNVSLRVTEVAVTAAERVERGTTARVTIDAEATGGGVQVKEGNNLLVTLVSGVLLRIRVFLEGALQ